MLTVMWNMLTMMHSSSLAKMPEVRNGFGNRRERVLRGSMIFDREKCLMEFIQETGEHIWWCVLESEFHFFPFDFQLHF